jgi:hypothetical protein
MRKSSLRLFPAVEAIKEGVLSREARWIIFVEGAFENDLSD